jgi:hypothetical protein
MKMILYKTVNFYIPDGIVVAYLKEIMLLVG